MAAGAQWHFDSCVVCITKDCGACVFVGGLGVGSVKKTLKASFMESMDCRCCDGVVIMGETSCLRKGAGRLKYGKGLLG